MTLVLQEGDDAILAMCASADAPYNGHYQDGGGGASAVTNGMGIPSLDGNPFKFDMSGSVMTVTNSQVQFGTKIVTTPAPNDVIDGPFLKVDDAGSGVELSSSPTFGETSLDSTEGSGATGSLNPRTLHIKITPNGPVETSAPHRRVNGSVLLTSPDLSLTHDAVPTPIYRGGVPPSPRPLGKTVSTPVPLKHPEEPSPLLRSLDSQLSPSRVPSSALIPHGTGHPGSRAGGPITPGGTFFNSDIHYGTQIVVYANSGDEKKAVSPACPPELLQDFRSRLHDHYRKRSRSPLLPWHLGRTMAPLQHYYLEPRIFSVDRRGLPTTTSVCLTAALTASSHESRFLVEGEAGVGKTLLCAHLAQAWTEGEGGLASSFGLVLYMSLGDYTGDGLEQHILREILPSYYCPNKVRQVWDYWKSHDSEILFILDGYDEMGQFEKCEVQNLIRGQDFPNSRVLVTSRPGALQCQATRLVVRGFDEHQMWKFIENYFAVVEDSNCGASLQDILQRHNKYRKLAERPLFCVLLCMLYETDSARKDLPDRMSDMLYKIMLCLIKWRKTREKNAQVDMDGFPAEYEKAFDQFGRVSAEALERDRHRFSEEDVKGVEHFDEIQQLGFLYKEDESDVLRVQVQKFWKPVHQTFIEYFAALHIANHIRTCRWGCRKCWKFSSLLARKDSVVLMFTAGVLESHAYRLFGMTRYPKLRKLSETQLLALLREAGPHQENKRTIAGLLDSDSVVISTNEAHIEGWTHLVPENFYKLQSVELVWRIKSTNPDQESSFVEASPEILSAFFKALHQNTSVQTLKIRAKQDGAVFTDEKLDIFFADLHRALTKRGLRNLEFRDLKFDLGEHLRSAFEKTASHITDAVPSGFSELRVLKLQSLLSNEDLRVVCDALNTRAAKLETLHLDGLELGHEGFTSLAKLLRTSSSLKHLYLSMNKALLLSVFGSNDQQHMRRSQRNRERESSPTPVLSQHLPLRLRRNAAQKSHDEFTSHEQERLQEQQQLQQQQENGETDVNAAPISSGVVTDSISVPSLVMTGVRKVSTSHPPSPNSLCGPGSHKPFLPATPLCPSPTTCSSDALSSWEDDYSSEECSTPTTSSSGGGMLINNHPFTELPFLFDLENDAVKKVPQARHYWFIKGSETRLPLPLCVTSEHKSVFHYLFSALAESKLQTLSLDQPALYLTIGDLVCLGDAVRQSKHLRTLDLQRLRKIKSYTPILIALAQSHSLESLNLSSDQVLVTDPSLHLVCAALRHNTSLRKVVFNNWKFQLQDKPACLRVVRAVLGSWRVREVSMRHCSVQLGPGDARAALAQLIFSPTIVTGVDAPSPPQQEQKGAWRTLTKLDLAEVEVVEMGPRRGPLLLPGLRSFCSLASLDLSASLSRPVTLDDSSCQHCFRQISRLANLRELTLNHWQFGLSETPLMLEALGASLQHCQSLEQLRLHNVDERRPGVGEGRVSPCNTSLLHTLVSFLPSLRNLSVCFYSINGRTLDEAMATWLASCLYQHWQQRSVTLQVFGVSSNVAAALKAGFSQGLCFTREKNGPPRILTLQIHRPLQPPCLGLGKGLQRLKGMLA